MSDRRLYTESERGVVCPLVQTETLSRMKRTPRFIFQSWTCSCLDMKFEIEKMLQSQCTIQNSETMSTSRLQLSLNAKGLTNLAGMRILNTSDPFAVVTVRGDSPNNPPVIVGQTEVYVLYCLVQPRASLLLTRFLSPASVTA